MEQNKNHPPLLVEAAAENLIRAFQQNRLPFLSSLIWAALAYLFAFTNKLINHDELGQLFGKGSTVVSGRWVLGVLDIIFPNVSMPWIYGVITVVFIAIAICLILRLFAIRSPILQVLLSGCIMVFPSLIGIFGYMFTSSSYGLSFFLAVLSVFLICKPSNKAILPALVCLVLSLGIYQAYISIAASLLVLVLIRLLLTGEEAPVVLKKGIRYVLFLVVGLIAYYLAWQAVLVIRDVQIDSYASGNLSLSPAQILKGIPLAYVNFFRFFSGLHGLMPTPLSRWIHILLLAAMAMLLCLHLARQKPCAISRIVLLFLLIGLLPLAVNCMYLVTVEDAVHTLVLYSFVAVYILAAILLDLMLDVAGPGKLSELLRRISLDGAAVALAILLAINTYTANSAYLTLHLRYENAYAFYSSLTAQIRQMPEFQRGTRIAVIGYWQSPDFYKKHVPFTYEMMGVNGFLPSDYSASYFMEYYIGFPAEFVTAEEAAALRQTEAFQEMACYPYYGSIGVIDDVIVVKFTQ